ncbi:peroxiredoxin [Nitrosovibrio sp. Nv6]|uniref:peroxiredoxin n=1 Tax=Nitrosovibrio sp. Nv6 TaxID=1855340 RepID=UPI0008B2D948|nr:peroxiredoxin [Nitrosovibrio sp. Nv6]SEP42976.1 Peroxiredoxin [Nitrosovibrio sp. Nv6]
MANASRIGGSVARGDPRAEGPGLEELSKSLAPVNDGACDHLSGLQLPSITLLSTAGRAVDLAGISGWLVIYCYPMTRRPGQTLPEGWEQILGAAGCTPQSCSFRDHFYELQTLNTQLFGISTQTNEDQLEVVERLHLPFELLSDTSFKFAQGLRLPMAEVHGMRLIKRVTLIARDGQVVKYFYPVSQPDKNIDDVLSWLRKGSHTALACISDVKRN